MLSGDGNIKRLKCNLFSMNAPSIDRHHGHMCAERLALFILLCTIPPCWRFHSATFVSGTFRSPAPVGGPRGAQPAPPPLLKGSGGTFVPTHADVKRGRDKKIYSTTSPFRGAPSTALKSLPWIAASFLSA